MEEDIILTVQIILVGIVIIFLIAASISIGEWRSHHDKR